METEPATVSELDLSLVHALQVRPRAAWSELAGPLGATAATLARRWEHLRSTGTAWVHAVPGPGYSRSRCSAFVLLSCEPGARTRVAAEVCGYEEVATVELTASARAGLLLDVLTPDFATLARLLTDRLDTVPGVTAVDCRIATSLHMEGTRWRLRSLDPAQLARLGAAGARESGEARVSEPDALDRRLIDALVGDGRLSWAALAESCGGSPATAQRRIRRLTGSGLLAFRCDMAAGLMGSPVPVTFLGRVAARDVGAVDAVLAALPECRLAAAVTGPDNVLATLWLADTGEIQRREAHLAARLPGLTVTDRLVGLRTVKRMGHLLDEAGRRTGTVPIRPW
ncbi:Lrp/AsnC family transcriptional regulator [Streptomyces sp. NPDC058426]|uniref:Lrp/AsnC family transcriptional regulator n=1 Tax=Streptomyces sp. NPDC058426 TaxID=3346493 RepID=UPI003652CE2A